MAQKLNFNGLVLRLWAIMALVVGLQSVSQAQSVYTLQGWQNLAQSWGGAITTGNSRFTEGELVNLRCVATLPAGSSSTINLKYDFTSGTGSTHFFDFLTSPTLPNASLLAGTGLTGNPTQDKQVMRDSAVPVQTVGSLRIWGGTITGFGGYALVNGVKVLPVTVSVPSGGKTRTVVIAYTAHLAREEDYAPYHGTGAASFPGTSRKARANKDDGSDSDVSLDSDSCVQTTDLAVTQSVSPAPVVAGAPVTVIVTVRNLGLKQASGVVLTDTAPPGAILSTTQGTITGSSIAIGSLAAGQQAVVTVKLTAPCAAFSNVATVRSSSIDPVPANNSVTTTVTPVDQTAPSLAVPADILRNTDPGVNGAMVTYPAPVAVDNCSATTVVLKSGLASGSVFPVGTTTVTYEATDAAGNKTSGSFSVTVKDLESPRLTVPASLVQNTDAGVCGAVVTYSAPVATDNCPGVITVLKAGLPSGSVFPVGITPVTYEAVDASGNSVTGSFTVTVNDVEPPKLSGLPTVPVIAFAAPTTCGTAVTLPVVTAVDSCALPQVLTGVRSDGLDPSVPFPLGTTRVAYTASDAAGNTASAAYDVLVLPLNPAWPVATRLLMPDPDPVTGLTGVSIEECISVPSQSRWYKFKVQPSSQLLVTLENLPENYDIVLYKDIREAYNALTQAQTTGDLTQINAEFAADAFSGAAFSPEAFAGAAFSGAAFSGAAWSGAAWSGAAFSGAAFSGAAWSPDAYAPDTFFGAAFSGAAFSGAAFSDAVSAGAAFSGAAFSGAAFSGAAFSGAAFSGAAWSGAAWSGAAFSGAAFSTEATSGAAWSGAAFSGAAFSDAQQRSIIGVSAFPGVGNEVILANTWDHDRDFYVRVRGRNGAFAPGKNYKLTVQMLTGACNNLTPVESLPASNTSVPDMGAIKTLILTDPTRLARYSGTPDAVSALQARLSTFAARPEIGGVVVDLGQDARIVAANTQADARLACVSAKNILASTIRDLVLRYRARHPEIEYVVLVGNDAVIPFFRHPDQGLLANENNYIPPVLSTSASEAVLQLGYFLSQDDYAAACYLPVKVSAMPIPDLGIGRLVESPAEVTAVLDAYESLGTGTVPTPTTALATGYDFLADDAQAIEAEFLAGLGHAVDTLIQPMGQSPGIGWTADQLRSKLLDTRHDLIFLGGHFSAVGALAADYQTRMTAAQLLASPVNLVNAIVFSAGCHSGYNIVNTDAVPLVTESPDWAQAFAAKGATLIAGTGYQYGDTDLIEYSERVYLNFARQLRAGAGPVPVGKALARAKSRYLSETPVLRGLHEKALLEATLFGLPMLSVDLPSGRGSLPGDTSVVSAPGGALLTPAPAPGQAFGLQVADISVNPTLTPVTTQLSDVDPGGLGNVSATYFSGGNGVAGNPAEPIFPLEIRNVTAAGQVLRGVGFRSASYSDEEDLRPLTSVATTELSGVHSPFLTDTFFPVRFWNVNYFDALCESSAALSKDTRLFVIPAQFISKSPGSALGTFRKFSGLDFRLYYDNNTTTYAITEGGTVKPSISSAPTIANVTDQVSSADPTAQTVKFRVRVTGNPFAGIQEVWVTYTGIKGTPGFHGQWRSITLSQPDPANDSSLWEATLPTGSVAPGSLRYVVQAVNGLGLVTLNTRLGAYYIPGGVEVVPTVTTKLTIDPADPAAQPPVNPASIPYSKTAKFRASLKASDGTSLPGQVVTFALGSQETKATTDAGGVAEVSFPVLGLPGVYELRASFEGDNVYLPSAAATRCTITRQTTALNLVPGAGTYYVKAGVQTPFVASLAAGGGNLAERTVFFVLSNPGLGTYPFPVITDFAGRAQLSPLPVGAVPDGVYQLSVYFGSGIPGMPVNASDPRYLDATTAGTLVINTVVVNDPSVAVRLPGPISIQSSSDGTGDCQASLGLDALATVESSLAGFVTVQYAVAGVAITSPHAFAVGTTPVTATATVAGVQAATTTFDVTVIDDEPPIALARNLTLQLDATGSATVSASQVDNGSSDNCSIASITVTPNVFTCANIGDNPVVLRVTDASGNVATATATVTVEDKVAPVALAHDLVVQLNASGTVSILPSDIDAGSHDACGGVILAVSKAAFTCADLGKNLVTLSVTDAHGNVAIATATVTVEDRIAPVAVGRDLTVQLDATGSASILPSDLDGGSHDACGIVSLGASQTRFTCADIGPNPVTLTVKDGSGNVGTVVATVTVVDSLPPIANCRPATAAVDPATGLLTVRATDIDNGTTDNCDVAKIEISKGIPTQLNGVFADRVTYGPAEVGTQSVTLRVTDPSGNQSTCSTTVTVPDIYPPVGSMVASPNVLSHSGHRLIPVQLTVNVADRDLSQLQYRIAQVGSNEPINGTGDGDTSPDWVFNSGSAPVRTVIASPAYFVSDSVRDPGYGWGSPGANILSLQLRGERAEHGNGRVYTVKVEIRDPAGNIGVATAQISVPSTGDE